MKIIIILLLIIMGACLAKTTLSYDEHFYGRGDDYYPHMFESHMFESFESNESKLSCINQAGGSPYKS